MRHLDLFSGIGGFSLAASWVWGDEHEIIAFCEIDKFCQKVLKKHWPDVPIFDDIKELSYEKLIAESYRSNGGSESGDSLHKRRTSCESGGASVQENSERKDGPAISNNQSTDRDGRTESETTDFTVDLITGGFPCQPFSVAGKRKGKEDDRALWPQYLRIIQEVRPRWIIGENVSGIINMELDTVLSDLEGEGYSCQTLIIPACAVNAPHRRDRVWIVASDAKNSLNGRMRGRDNGNQRRSKCSLQAERSDSHAPDSEKSECELSRGTRARGEGFTDNGTWDEPWLEVATRLCGVAHGIPDRVHRLKALGNAIVPQVAYPILKAIKEIEEETCNVHT